MNIELTDAEAVALLSLFNRAHCANLMTTDLYRVEALVSSVAE